MSDGGFFINSLRGGGMGKNQHVVRKGDVWGVKGENNQKASSLHNTQAQAIKAAIKIAKNEKSEVIIHGMDGKIRDKDSYGNDPCPPKDTKH